MSDPNGPADDGGNEHNGLGVEGTIPAGSQGVGVGTGEQTTFEPEEDPEAAAGEAGGEDSADGFSGHS